MGSSSSFVQKTLDIVAPAVGYVARKQRLKAEEKGRREQAVQTKAAQQEQERQQAIAAQSIAAQKEKARKRTIFAGSGTNNIFSPTLGGTSNYNTTLG